MLIRARLPHLLIAAATVLVLSAAASAQEVAPAHGMAMYGDLKYGPDFEHFDYVDPNAPKGGTVTFSAVGTFDNAQSVHPQGHARGRDRAPVRDADGVVVRRAVLRNTACSPRSVEMPKDRSWVAFTLRPEARCHDGSPVTVEDVIWSFDTLKEKGAPLLPPLLRQRGRRRDGPASAR